MISLADARVVVEVAGAATAVLISSPLLISKVRLIRDRDEARDRARHLEATVSALGVGAQGLHALAEEVRALTFDFVSGFVGSRLSRSATHVVEPREEVLKVFAEILDALPSRSRSRPSSRSRL